ncbi:MAG: hypothetical protein K2N30_03105, partial [Clostridia bacterium]|nr:hypothetical protein [Clostridia bacterium]
IEGDPEFKTAEKITYAVKFDNSAATNTSYSVSYGDGTYTTVFYAATIDKNSGIIHENFKSGYPDGKITVYCYETSLITGETKFTFQGEDKVFEGGESKVTKSYFLSVEDRLRPVYSYQKFNSVSPAVLNATSLEDTYAVQKCEYTTYYSWDGSQAITDADENGEKSVKTTDGLNNTANTMFDLAYLDIAVRACKLSATLSQQISLYTAHSGVSDYTLSGNARALADGEKTAITAKLKDKGLYVPSYKEDDKGNQVEEGLNTVAVSVTYNGELSGVSQTYWFAAIGNARNNTGRATLLKIEYPLTFNLGVSNFTLQSIESTLWDGKN